MGHFRFEFLGLLQDHFVLIVSEFMFIPWDYAQKQAANRASLQNVSSCTPSITIAAAETFESHLVEYLRGQVSLRNTNSQNLYAPLKASCT